MTSQRRTVAWAAAGGAAGALILMAAAMMIRPPRGFPLPALQTPATAPPATVPATGSPVQAPPAAATFTPIPTLDGPANLEFTAGSESTSTVDSAVATIAAGGLQYSGPLSHAQQVALFRASVGFERTTVAESIQESKAINGAGYGDPSNVCGPLAIAILRAAQLVPPQTVPHDFWPLDPRTPTDKEKLAQVFPTDGYDHLAVSTAINAVDWTATPLEPGDFVFIWHGSGGNFDHMLVVNRVDPQQRAYAVTNFGTTAGYIIAETMLYDPADPSAGIFHEWTKEKNAILGSTGFGGYEIWRLHGE
jgi:hypothetical protein